jgi:hypothetical protein
MLPAILRRKRPSQTTRKPVLAADLQFDEATHRYTVGGVRFPSVTEVLDPLLELDGVPKAVLKAAAEFGTHVHMACDLFDKGVLDEPALDPHLAPYLAAWKIFLRDTGAVVDATEVRVVHAKLRYAGTFDKGIHWKKRGRTRTALLDIKSGEVPRTVGPQTAAYAEAHPFKFDERYVLQLRGDATYRLAPLTESTDWSIFLSALNLHRWRMK